MSFEVSLVIAFFIIFTAVVVVASRQSRARQQAREEDLKRGASARGWTFSSTSERGYHTVRFSGTTDGIAWEAESAVVVIGGRNRNRRYVGRWHGRWSPGLSAPLLAMGVPKGKEVMQFQVAQGDGFFATMAQKAVGFALDKAIDMYFGDPIGTEVDAATLRQVADVSVPGFILMAADIDEARRILGEGLQRALLDASGNAANLLSESDRPWVMLRPRGISLARMEQIRDTTELDQFVRAGVALTRAFRFGRPV